MTMQRHIRTALFALAALAAWQGASAQHTLGFTVGYGMGNGRFQPQQEMRAIWGLYSGAFRGATTASNASWGLRH